MMYVKVLFDCGTLPMDPLEVVATAGIATNAGGAEVANLLAGMDSSSSVKSIMELSLLLSLLLLALTWTCCTLVVLTDGAATIPCTLVVVFSAVFTFLSIILPVASLSGL